MIFVSPCSIIIKCVSVWTSLIKRTWIIWVQNFPTINISNFISFINSRWKCCWNNCCFRGNWRQVKINYINKFNSSSCIKETCIMFVCWWTYNGCCSSSWISTYSLLEWHTCNICRTTWRATWRWRTAWWRWAWKRTTTWRRRAWRQTAWTWRWTTWTWWRWCFQCHRRIWVVYKHASLPLPSFSSGTCKITTNKMWITNRH